MQIINLPASAYMYSHLHNDLYILAQEIKAIFQFELTK